MSNGDRYTPEQWAQILKNAGMILQREPTNVRALTAFRAAAPHVGAQRAIEARVEYLKDVDPGALASFGLGVADMMSFGLGDQVARKLLGQEATLTQEAAKSLHPLAHTAGEIAGVVTPAGAEAALVKAGKLTPSVIRAAVSGIKSKTARAAARVALDAVTGATYTAAQAAGRTEGGLGERAQAGVQAAPYGAAAGAAARPVIAGLTQLARPATRYAGRVIGQIAGKQPPPAVPGAVPPMPGLLGVGEDIGALPARAPAAPPVGRPGEVLSPIPGQPQGLQVTGPAPPLAQGPFPPTIGEMQGLTRPPPMPPPLQVGRSAVPGRPDLGTLVPPGPYQKAGPPVRTASPSYPGLIELRNPALLDRFSVQTVIERLKFEKKNLTAEQLKAVMAWIGRQAQQNPTGLLQ